MKKLSITLFAITLTLSQINAQKTGKVEYKTLGIEFTIPNGWVGQEGDGLFIIGSQTVPGLVIVTTNDAKSVDQMKNEARQGIADQNGTNLQVNGSFEDLGNNAVGADLQGTLEWQAVKGYILGMVNPIGTGVTIMVASTPQQYSDQLKQAAFQIQNSIKFKKPETGPIVQKWKNEIVGRRLHYLNSYYSGGAIGGGYDDETIIELCTSGSFYYYSKSNTTISGDGISAYNSDGDNGNGKWEVTANVEGQGVLKLNFRNGEVYTYTLSFQDKYVHLNGYKYYRVNPEYCR